MTYVPGTLVALFGVYSLIRGLLAKYPEERKGHFVRAGIDFAIAIALFVLNVTVFSRPS